MKTIKVVCGIIWKDGRILLARRKLERPLGGYWEFPGGKVEPNEDYIAALERELIEELGLEISNIRFFDIHIHSYDTLKIELIAFEANFKSATFQLKDHDKIEFVQLDLLTEYQLAPADRFFIPRIMKK